MARRDKCYDSGVAAILAANYDILQRRCRRLFRRGALDFEDVMQDTMLFVMCDTRAASIATTEELLEYYVYKFRMMVFQTIKRNRRMAAYADGLKNSLTETDDGMDVY